MSVNFIECYVPSMNLDARSGNARYYTALLKKPYL